MADFTLSPGITINEVDNTIRKSEPIPAYTSVGGVIGNFNWGPIDEPTIISSEAQLISQFNEPTLANYVEWYNAKNYLDYAENASIVRISHEPSVSPYSSAYNAVMNHTSIGIPPTIQIKNDRHYLEKLSADFGGFNASPLTGDIYNNINEAGAFIARYAGELGNSIRVEFCTSTEKEHSYKFTSANTINVINYDHANTKLSLLDANANTISFTTNDYFHSTTNAPLYNEIDAIFYSSSITDQSAQAKVVEFKGSGNTYTGFMVSGGTDEFIVDSLWEFNPTPTTGKIQMVPVSANISIPLNLTDFSFAVKTKSLFREYSYDFPGNKPASLLGKVYYDVSDPYTVYGRGTAFEKQVGVGDIIYIGSRYRATVESIVSDTELTIRQDVKLYDTVSYNDATYWSRAWKYSLNFTKDPSTSESIRKLNNNLSGDYYDQLHLLVIDADGKLSGTVGKILEKYAFLSLAKDGRTDADISNYYLSEINNKSSYLRWNAHIDQASAIIPNWGDKALRTTPYNTYNKVVGNELQKGTLEFGKNCSTLSSNNPDDVVLLENAIELYRDKFSVPLDYFITGWTGFKGTEYKTIVSKMIKLCEERQDAVVPVSAPYEDIFGSLTTVNNQNIVDSFILWRTGIVDSSYGFMDSNYKYQYDSYNDTYRWVPLASDIAGLMARCDIQYRSWDSPAGFTRGKIKNTIQLAWNPNQTNRDDLYEEQINSVIAVRGEGYLLFGDKTLQRLASSFDRINVRKLFIVMKTFISALAQKRIFEYNNDIAQFNFKKSAVEFLDTIKANEGIRQHKVVCDSTNNTFDVVQNNQFVADIYVSPGRVVNFVKLNFTATDDELIFAETE